MLNDTWESFPACIRLCAHGAPLPPRGLAPCWRQRCPGASRLRWGSAPPGHDTTPTRTSFSSPSPGQMWRKDDVSSKETVRNTVLILCIRLDSVLMHDKHMADAYYMKTNRCKMTSADSLSTDLNLDNQSLSVE